MTVTNMKEKLNVFHIAILIYMIELDITIFELPRVIAQNIGTNGWLGFIALSCLASFNIYLYWLVYKMGNGRSVFHILEGAIPKAFLYPFYLLCALVWIGLASLIGKHFIFVFQLLFLQSMNPMIIFFLLCIMVYSLLSKDLYSISKASTMFFILTIWILGLSFFYFNDWKIIRFTTSYFQGASEAPSIHGWAEVYQAFIGYELCMFLFPYVNKESKWFRGVFGGHWLVTFVQLIVIWITFGFYSLKQLQTFLYPLINLWGYVELPFINRIESIIFPFFLLVNLISTVMYCFAALVTVKQIFPKARPKLLEIVITCITYIAGFITLTLRKSEELLSFTFNIETGIAFSFPIILIIILQLQKRKGRNTKGET